MELPLNASTSPLAGETSFELNDFSQNDIKESREGLAHKVLFLLITEPGTYPEDPELGVGIKRFLLELDVEGRTELAYKVRIQLDRYLPNTAITGVKINEKEIRGINYLYVSFTIPEDSSKPLALVFAEEKGELLHKLII